MQPPLGIVRRRKGNEMNTEYELYDFENGCNIIGYDNYYCIEAKNPISAVESYLRENKIQGRAVRTITDTDTRFIVRNHRGSYLYQLITD